MATTNSSTEQVSQSEETSLNLDDQYDRKSELKDFDNTKSGVKGLVDSGISKLPRIFVSNISDAPSYEPQTSCKLTIPFIDLHGTQSEEGMDAPRWRKKVLDELKYACEEWGFFQVVNHGIPQHVLDGMIDGVRRFHEQDTEFKKQYYSRDRSKNFLYNSNFDLYRGSVANWRDSFKWFMATDQPDPLYLPEICRDVVFDYAKQVKKLGVTLLRLFSEALGLKPDRLKETGCSEGLLLLGHYYPACPEPELAIGTSSHTDSDFFTVLLQDLNGGLQILHDNRWVDVPPCPGALVINIGDLLQIATNDQFKSVFHRVLARETGPRISAACFFMADLKAREENRSYGPVRELLPETNPPIYKEVTIREFEAYCSSKGLDRLPTLPHFKLDPTG